MRRRDERIGVLNVFGAHPGTLTDDQAMVSRAMADIATIGILQQRAIHQAQVTVEQLEVALVEGTLTPDVLHALQDEVPASGSAE